CFTEDRDLKYQAFIGVDFRARFHLIGETALVVPITYRWHILMPGGGMTEVCYRCEKAPRVNQWHCQACRDFLAGPPNSSGSGAGMSSNAGCLIFGAIIIVLFVVIGRCSDADWSTSTSSSPSASSTRSSGSGYERATDDLGIDADRYERSARSHGLEASEALAADLVICRETGDCPAGMTQREARSYICRRTGDC
ncbi:hypothetical protein, partial [Brevundimonas guildfordensis]|uniref:hypothetical protein n=1 Tax=Brevundimonas guildfordensis TaxID=2762241 RepID=UPI001CD8A36C